MSQPQFTLFIGDAHRCEVALDERESALRETDPAIERYVRFGDEIDAREFGIELQSASLFAFGRHFVVRQLDRCKKGKDLAASLEGEFPSGTYVSLIAESLRATNPVVKGLKKRDAVVSLPTPKGRGIHSAIREILATRGIDASAGVINQLVLRNGGDLLGIAQEADKLRTAGVAVTETTIDRWVFPSAERTAYPFYDYLGEGRLQDALRALREIREDPGRLLRGVLMHCTRLAMIRLVLDQKGPRPRVSDAVGLPDWLCKRLMGQAKQQTVAERNQTLAQGIALDVDVKKGRISPEDALLQLVFIAAASRDGRSRQPSRSGGLDDP